MDTLKIPSPATKFSEVRHDKASNQERCRHQKTVAPSILTDRNPNIPADFPPLYPCEQQEDHRS